MAGMLGDLFATLIFNPLYNGLILFVDVVPGGDLGIAVILLTILVKLLLFPLSLKAVRTQMLMREIEEPMKELREKYKDDRQEQARRIMELYKEKKINPFSSIFLILIQLPIIFGLYWVFLRGGLPDVQPELLYSFVGEPERVKVLFLGLIDMTARSAPLALLAGLTQFIQTQLSLPPLKPREKENASLKDDLAHSFQLQMRYVLPVVVAVISYIISSAVALYWTTSNLFSIGQELYMRRTIKRQAPQEEGAAAAHPS